MTAASHSPIPDQKTHVDEDRECDITSDLSSSESELDDISDPSDEDGSGESDSDPERTAEPSNNDDPDSDQVKIIEKPTQSTSDDDTIQQPILADTKHATTASTKIGSSHTLILATEVKIATASVQNQKETQPSAVPSNTCTAAKETKQNSQVRLQALFHTVRPPGPSESELTNEQRLAIEVVIDMAEHSFDLEVVELIRLGDHVLKHGYDCCHPDTSEPTTSVFKCADCGTVAETVPREWDETRDTAASKQPRFNKLIQTYFSKPIDPAFK
jgi:hypothetical protein